MRIVRGKRKFAYESMWGVISLRCSLTGARTLGLIFGRSVLGVQWSPTKKRSSSGSASTSRKSSRSTGSK